MVPGPKKAKYEMSSQDVVSGYRPHATGSGTAKTAKSRWTFADVQVVDDRVLPIRASLVCFLSARNGNSLSPSNIHKGHSKYHRKKNNSLATDLNALTGPTNQIEAIDAQQLHE